MTWHYQILKYKDGSFGLHEIYYDDDDKLIGHTEKPVSVGDTVEEILEDLEMMVVDIERFEPIDEPEYEES